MAVGTIHQLRAINRATYSGIRAVTATRRHHAAVPAPVAATYYLMAKPDPNNFNGHSLTGTDALYFTVSIFSTVGFGDINAISQATRLLVTRR